MPSPGLRVGDSCPCLNGHTRRDELYTCGFYPAPAEEPGLTPGSPWYLCPAFDEEFVPEGDGHKVTCKVCGASLGNSMYLF